MGYTTALALEEELSLEAGLAYHLQGNHYPPVPVAMVQPCIDAIDAFYDEEYSREINLPEGILWRGQTSCPASAIVDAHHLEAWLPQYEDQGSNQACEITHTLGISNNKIGLDKCQTPMLQYYPTQKRGKNDNR